MYLETPRFLKNASIAMLVFAGLSVFFLFIPLFSFQYGASTYTAPLMILTLIIIGAQLAAGINGLKGEAFTLCKVCDIVLIVVSAFHLMLYIIAGMLPLYTLGCIVTPCLHIVAINQAKEEYAQRERFKEEDRALYGDDETHKSFDLDPD